MEKSLIGTFVCTTCGHNATVCTCLDRKDVAELGINVDVNPKVIKRVISFVDFTEDKYHAQYHGSRPQDCYQRYKR